MSLSDFGWSNIVHTLQCPSCDFQTLRPEALKEHCTRSHRTLQRLVVFSCPLCHARSTDVRLIDEHKRLYHTTDSVQVRQRSLSNLCRAESLFNINLVIPIDASFELQSANFLGLTQECMLCATFEKEMSLLTFPYFYLMSSFDLCRLLLLRARSPHRLLHAVLGRWKHRKLVAGRCRRQNHRRRAAETWANRG